LWIDLVIEKKSFVPLITFPELVNENETPPLRI